jgi:RNA polymerase sigma-70 factor, ECF subfamily
MDSPITYGCHNKAWRQHKTEIRNFLLNRAASAAEADDMLQDVFLKALLQGKDFCRLENPRAWLFQVARNLIIDRLRLSKDQVPLPDDLPAQRVSEAEPVDLLSQCLPRVLSELSPEDSEAITLCDTQGMSQKEYAARLGLSLPGAKSRIQRARLRLRSQLAKACQITFDDDGKVCCFVPRPPVKAGIVD